MLTHSRMVVALAAVAVLSCLPLFLFDLGGDVLLHYVLIECFSREFWSGNIYPRWCFDADAGMGSPAFMFYFPLGYWPAAWLYPLKWLGLSVPQIHILACVAASLLTALTSYRWLRGIVPPWQAMVGAMVYLLVPYRMEVMLYRAAYAELWGLAILPLVFLGWRNLAHGKSGAVLQLAMAQALLALAHTPQMLIAAIMGVPFLLFTAVRPFYALACYGLAGMLAMVMSGFYLLPAKLFQPFTQLPLVIDRWSGWPNRFLSSANVTDYHQERLVIIIVLVIVLALSMAIRCFLMRDELARGVHQRDIAAWIFLLALSILLLSPVSQPFWGALEPVRSVAFPWRVQSVIAAALVMFIALHATRPKSEKKERTKTGDAVALVGLMSLVSFFMLSVRGAELAPTVQRSIDLQMINVKEYYTVWTEKSYAPSIDDTRLLDMLSQEPRAEVVAGSALVSPLYWKAGRIVLGVKSFNDSVIRLRQRYFPIWYSAGGADEGSKVTLSPQQNSGWILVRVPKGEFELVLKASAFYNYELIAVAYMCSFVGWGAVLLLWWRTILPPRKDF